MQILRQVMKKKWGRQVKIGIDHEGTQAVVFVALDGWDKDKYENREGHKVSWGNGITGQTTGKQIRLSMNSPLKMTYEEWREFVEAVERGYQYLLDGPPPDKV